METNQATWRAFTTITHNGTSIQEDKAGDAPTAICSCLPRIKTRLLKITTIDFIMACRLCSVPFSSHNVLNEKETQLIIFLTQCDSRSGITCLTQTQHLLVICEYSCATMATAKLLRTVLQWDFYHLPTVRRERSLRG